MSDRWVVVLAIVAAAGASRPSAAPVALAVAAAVVAMALRRPLLLCLAVGVLTSGLASRSLAGLDGVVEGPVAGEATLLTDPAPHFEGIRAEVRLGHRRLDLRAAGVAAEALSPLLAGEVVRIVGVVEPLRQPSSWTRSRHLAGRLIVHRVDGASPGSWVARGTSSLRRTIERGSAPLSADGRSLFAGLVLGDDRFQSAQMADDFRGAGLTHLLAVSGQNVAFALAVVGPVLRRLRIWPRALVALGVIALFAALTRFEPSVLRASAMAAVATLAGTTGSPANRLRLLGLAVTALLVVDPLLVLSVGFQLSVAAAAAIVLLAPPLAGALPGPPWLRAPLSVTAAAQLGVAPILLLTFGPLPVASVPANLLAVPAAGFVMMWGLTAGLVAGLTGAALLHLPTQVLVGWIRAVAHRSAALPLGRLDAWDVALIAVGLAVACVAGRASALRRSALALVAAVLVAVSLAIARPPSLRTVLAPGLVRWHEDGIDVVVLEGDRRSLSGEAVLQHLREAGVDAIDLLVVADDQVAEPTVREVGAAHELGAIVSMSPMDGVAEAAVVSAPVRPTVVRLGPVAVLLAPAADRLVVEVSR